MEIIEIKEKEVRIPQEDGYQIVLEVGDKIKVFDTKSTLKEDYEIENSRKAYDDIENHLIALTGNAVDVKGQLIGPVGAPIPAVLSDYGFRMNNIVLEIKSPNGETLIGGEVDSDMPVLLLDSDMPVLLLDTSVYGISFYKNGKKYTFEIDV